MDPLTLIIIIVYLFALGYLGYRGYSQTKTATDYLVAGRSVNPIVMALSYGATFISTSAIVGFGGVAALFGMSLLWLTFLNIFIGIFIAFVFLGGPTRRMGHHLDAHTFPELLAKRFNSKFIQIFSGLVIFVFMPLYAMAVMNGAAEFMRATFNINFDVALGIFAIIVAVYVIMGGLKGVMLTDALQGSIMLVGMIVLLFVTYGRLGGPTEAHTALAEIKVPKSLVAMGHQGMAAMPTLFSSLWWIVISTITMGVGIGVLAQPQLIVRFMTVKSKKSLNRAVVMGGLFIFFMTGVAFIVGPVSNVYFANKEGIKCNIISDNVLMDPGEKGASKLSLVADDATDEVKKRGKRFIAYKLPGEGDEHKAHYILFTGPDKITRGTDGQPDVIRPGLISIARTITLGTTMKGNRDSIIPEYVISAMPKWFGLVFMLTLLSAGMSTVSSQFHAIGTSIGRDVFEQVTHTRSSKSVLITRLGILVGIIIAIVLGKVVRGNIIALATAIFFGLCGSTFLPAFIGGLLSKRMTRIAAVSSMLVGFFSSMFWLVFMNIKTAGGLGICMKLFDKPSLVLKKTLMIGDSKVVDWMFVDPVVIALPLAIITAIVVTIISKPMDKAHVDYCFGGPKPGSVSVEIKPEASVDA